MLFTIKDNILHVSAWFVLINFNYISDFCFSYFKQLENVTRLQ